MADFEVSIAKTLRNEGGFADRSATTGEVVNMGITLSTLRSLHALPPPEASGPPVAEEIAFISNINTDFAKDFYLKQFWTPMRCAELASQAVADKLFDLAVNVGRKQSTLFLQRAINKVQWPGGIAEDGVIGSATIAFANRTDSGPLLAAVRAQAECFYRELAAKDPALAPNLGAPGGWGWLGRLYR